jgi:hypothetical protein
MNFMRKNWYYVGGVLFVALAALLAILWNQMSVLQRLLMSFMAFVFFAYPFYVLAIGFPNLIWMGLAQVLFGMAQLGVHGFLINRKMHSIYNPGLFAVVFLHWPIGITYIWYVSVHGLVRGWNWPVAIVYTAAAAFFGVNMVVTRWFADKHSPYPFSEKEMARFHLREKMERRNE